MTLKQKNGWQFPVAVDSEEQRLGLVDAGGSPCPCFGSTTQDVQVFETAQPGVVEDHHEIFTALVRAAATIPK